MTRKIEKQWLHPSLLAQFGLTPKSRRGRGAGDVVGCGVKGYSGTNHGYEGAAGFRMSDSLYLAARCLADE